MDLRRKTIYALICAAVIINIGYGLVNNGIPTPFGEVLDDNDFSPDITDEFVIPPLRDGSIYRSNYNMSVEVALQKEDNGQSGEYHLEGISTRSIMLNRMIREIEGPYVLAYELNETNDLEIRGQLKRIRDTSISDAGVPLDEKVTTSISVIGPKGYGSSSSIDTELKEITSVRSDLVWKKIIPSDGLISVGMKGSIRTDLNFQEAGLSLDRIDLVWEVVSITRDLESRKAVLRASSDLGQNRQVDIELTMADISAWPVSMEVSVSGMFDTDEGPASVDMHLIEKLSEKTEGEGTEMSFAIFSPMGPPHSEGNPGMMPLIPEEGGDTEFRSSPRETLEFYLEQGGYLEEMIERYGWDDLSVIDLSYTKNDTVDVMWTWNITIASPPTDGLSETVTFEIGVEGGGILDQKRFSLVSENKGFGFRYSDPERGFATLLDNENILRSSDFNDIFFRSDGYANSFGFDVLRRGTTCSDVGSILFMNMLGVERADVNDLFISSALDRTDRSIMYLVVVDGEDGSLISTTQLEGASVYLFNAYGFDLA